MSEFETEMRQKVDDFGEGLNAIHKKLDACKERVDGITETEIKSINEKVCDALEDANKLKAKQDELEKQNKKIEELICNHGAKTVNTMIQKSKDALDDFSTYIRKGTPLKDETVNFMADSMVTNKYKGMSSEEKTYIKNAFVNDVDPNVKGYWLASDMKTLQVQVDPDGGYWVDPERLSENVDRQFETSPVRQFATIVNTNTESVEHIITDEAAPTGGWVSERQSRPETNTPQIGKLTIHTHEQYAMPAATQKMLDDAGFDIAAWLQGEVNDQFIRDENTAFVVGDGNLKPKGFLTYPNWSAPKTYTRGALEQIETLNSLSIVGDDVKKLKRSLLQFYQPNSAFFMNRETFGEIERLKDGENRYLLDTNSLKVGDTEVLLGKQVVFMDDIPYDLSVANQLVIVYGDMRKSYEVVDRIGIRVLRDPYTQKPEILFYSTKRVGGAVKNYQGLKILRVKA
jgi:HK97 family phage major capsid protein